jgi:AraC-like DNA-binding protein
MEQESYTLPASHALDVAEAVRAWSISQEALFDGLGLEAATLERPDARITLSRFITLIERARSLAREPALGIQLGLRMRLPTHGFLGFAAMTAASLREALELAVRYAPTRTNALRLELRVQDGEANLYVDELADLGSARDAILQMLTVGLWQLGMTLTGQNLTGSAEFPYARPEYVERFERLALPVRFGAPRTRLVFAAALLDLPIGMANPAALHLAREQCERALDALDVGDLKARVREALPRGRGAGFHNLDEVAAKLGVSARTLKRKLRAEGTAFSDILDQLAIEQARQLLRSALSVEQVAERMGYSDVSNFGRAFRRWTGTSPAAYRRETER